MNGPLFAVGVALICFGLAIGAEGHGWPRTASAMTHAGLLAMAMTLLLAAVWS
jgi:hypothetical protein